MIAGLLQYLLLGHAMVVGSVQLLTRDNWHEHITGRHDWFIMFSQQGCPHCKRLEPMWEAMETRLGAAGEGVRVGRVNVSTDNGIALTFDVERFPTLLLLSADGRAYEFQERRRSLPLLSAFATGGYRNQLSSLAVPTTLRPNEPQWWLLLRSLWKPLKQTVIVAFSIAACLAGGIKLLIYACGIRVPEEAAEGEATNKKKAG